MATKDDGSIAQYFSDTNARIRDIEEKQRLLKDRIILVGNNLVEERRNTFAELQELKKEIVKLKEENSHLRDFIQRITDRISDTARKEELMILQRQFDMFKPHLK